MPEPMVPETSRQRVMRYRANARKLMVKRTLNADEAEDAVAEMIRRNISEQGA